MKHLRMALSLACVILIGSGAALPKGKDQADMDHRNLNPTDSVAKDVREGRRDVRVLVDEVIASHAWEDLVPGLGNRLRARVESAEANFRNRKRRGVSDSAIAAAINRATVKLGLPEYARTTRGQIADLRMFQVFLSPNLMTPQDPESLESTRKAQEKPVEVELSPLQAVFMVRQLLEQKLTNDEYLQTPAEWARTKKEGKRRQDRGGSPAETIITGSRFELRDESPKQKEFRLRLFESLARLESQELELFIDGLLKDIGIE